MSAPFRSDGASLLPHEGRAVFVEEAVESGEGSLVCVGRIPHGSPFSREGMVPGFVLMELAAQAAAIEVLERSGGEGAGPRVGYIVRADGLSWIGKGVPAGAALTASVRREDSIPPLYMYRAAVTLDDAEVFSGGFTLYVDEEPG